MTSTFALQDRAACTAYLSQLASSGWRALNELRRSGEIKGVGAGINEMGMMPRFLDLVDLDFYRAFRFRVGRRAHRVKCKACKK